MVENVPVNESFGPEEFEENHDEVFLKLIKNLLISRSTMFSKNIAKHFVYSNSLSKFK